MLWSGISFEKGKVVHEGREQEFVIAMTEEESNDKSYREYLMAAEREKTLKELKEKVIVPPKEGSREALRDIFRDMVEYKKRKQERPNRKYF